MAASRSGGAGGGAVPGREEREPPVEVTFGFGGECHPIVRPLDRVGGVQETSEKNCAPLVCTLLRGPVFRSDSGGRVAVPSWHLELYVGSR